MPRIININVINEEEIIKDKIDSLETSLKFENLINLNDLERQFERDCK